MSDIEQVDIADFLDHLCTASLRPEAHESAKMLASLYKMTAAEIRRLREERRWVSVGERLPADNVAVLCWVDGCGAEMVWREKGQWFLSFAGYPISDSTYTHWQPLPPGPEANG